MNHYLEQEIITIGYRNETLCLHRTPGIQWRWADKDDKWVLMYVPRHSVQGATYVWTFAHVQDGDCTEGSFPQQAVDEFVISENDLLERFARDEIDLPSADEFYPEDDYHDSEAFLAYTNFRLTYGQAAPAVAADGLAVDCTDFPPEEEDLPF